MPSPSLRGNMEGGSKSGFMGKGSKSLRPIWRGFSGGMYKGCRYGFSSGTYGGVRGRGRAGGGFPVVGGLDPALVEESVDSS